MKTARSLLAVATAVGALASPLASFVGCSRDSAKNDSAPASSSAAESSSAPQPGPPPSAAMNALPLPSASVAASVNPGNLPIYDGPTGSVEGTVWIDGDAAPDSDDQDFASCPGAEALYKKKFREGATAGPNHARPVADALVGATGYPAFVPERAEAKRIAFDNCTYGTRTVALTFGQRLEVTNKTKRAIAPGLDQMFAPALMIAPPEEKGDPVKIYPQRPGYFTMSDRLGGSGKQRPLDVYVLLFPTHDVSDPAGHFRIDGIPVGKVDVFARLRAIGQETSQKVEIRAGVVQKVDLTLHFKPSKAPADAGPHPKVIP